MMKRSTQLIMMLISLIAINSYGQSTKAEAFKTLGLLVGGTWTYEGKWENGEPFKQEIKYSWGLDEKILKVQTYGIVDNETKAYGLRNEGIRAWDKESEKMKFYEFDVFGGTTEGYCIFEESQFHYEYYYEVMGKQELFRDTWKYINQDTYQFTVSMKLGSEWKIYTNNEYKRVK